ncbi:MAG: MFS transporter, partial [Parvibaculales bacterium]
PENRSPDIFEQTAKRARLKIKDKRIRDYLYISSLGGLLQAVILQLTGFFILDVMHMDTMETAKFLSVGMMSMAAANIFAQSYVVPRYPMPTDRQIKIGAVSMMIGFLLFLFDINLIILTLAMMFIGYGLGLTRTGSASGASLNVTPFEQGAIAGLLSSTATIGIIFTPIIIVPLYRFYDRGPYILCILLLVSLLYANKRAKIVTAELEQELNSPA